MKNIEKKLLMNDIRLVLLVGGYNDVLSETFAYGVAPFETGDFTSEICVKQFNLFGMKCPVKRETYCKGTDRGHAKFVNYRCSVMDLVLWLDYVKFPKDLRDTFSVINMMKQKGYFEADLKHYFYNVSYWKHVYTMDSNFNDK